MVGKRAKIYNCDMDRKSTIQNSGVRIDAFHEQFNTARACGLNSYYGFVEEIWELDYVLFKILLFRCPWVKLLQGVKVDKYGVTTVDLKHLANKNRHVVLHRKRRIVGVENVVDEEEYNQFDELPPFRDSIRLDKRTQRFDYGTVCDYLSQTIASKRDGRGTVFVTIIDVTECVWISEQSGCRPNDYHEAAPVILGASPPQHRSSVASTPNSKHDDVQLPIDDIKEPTPCKLQVRMVRSISIETRWGMGWQEPVGFLDPHVVSEQTINQDASYVEKYITMGLLAQDDKDYILVSYNQKYHWILLVIIPKRNKVIYLDSLLNKTYDFTLVKGILDRSFIAYVAEGGCRQQKQDHLCAFYVCHHMQQIMSAKLKDPEGLNIDLDALAVSEISEV
uniref:PH01B001I13.3 protein n=1 Tax=Phyllostachys edulis TaxID=38705 RepID=L0P2D3_PHYED|nr:PH01B001I13.3 [Phyllostachys edulis]